MRKLTTVVSIMILALILNAETAREKLERLILSAYTDMGFYDGGWRNREYMVSVMVSKKEPYSLLIRLMMSDSYIPLSLSK